MAGENNVSKVSFAAFSLQANIFNADFEAGGG
jgi:hypothetical protein